ncbi:MAG TPA: GNAT family N-acetyltransferase [Amaricoccus sp.]|nr:GNAT family N-acetyltransferase [Amaricoccus sp.]
MFMRLEAPALRPARQEDAEDLARLADLAAEGLASAFWAGLAGPGERPLDVGIRRAAGGEGAFSWRTAVMAEVHGRVAGALVAYHARGREPVGEVAPVFRPLQALENRAAGTLYLNVIATYPEFRCRGVASRLLAEAERWGRGARGGLSVIVADRNHPARRLYEAFGFREAGREPMVKDGWASLSEAWVLMMKPLG